MVITVVEVHYIGDKDKPDSQLNNGTLSTFNPATEPWATYYRESAILLYCKWSPVRWEEVYNTFITVWSYKIIHSIIGAQTLSSIKYDELIKMLKCNYDPKPSLIVQRFKFCNRAQEASETVSTFVTALWQIHT